MKKIKSTGLLLVGLAAWTGRFALTPAAAQPADTVNSATMTAGDAARVTKPKPDLANVPYGPHERNVLDFWKARPDRLSKNGPGRPPLVIYIHGGGFRSGDKTSLRPAFLEACLEAGFAVAAINYRLSHQASSPAFMHDGARAIQFLRANANRYDFDPHRIAATGGSAGAGISLWIGFHDDLADSASTDPIARQSTRLTSMAVINGQCSYDPRFFAQHGIGQATEHPFITPFYGLDRSEFDTPKAHRLFVEAAPITYISADDPPVLMLYAQPDDPIPADAIAKRNDPTRPGELPAPDPITNRAVHHPVFGRVLKAKLAALGVECTVHTNVRNPADYDGEVIAFFRRHFQPTPRPGKPNP